MISFEILGEVTARQGAWKANLTRRQQRLLAALVLGKGAPVGRERLEEILWDSHAPYDPEKAINQVACEVRGQLRLASQAGDDLVPSSRGGYRLSFTPEQADVLRFREKADEARRARGPASAELMRQALREWGPEAVGLHGSHPLRGLPGQWADSTRHLLRSQYRDAVIHCLTLGVSCHDYRPVLLECEERASDQLALLDEEFAGIWMLAAAGTGDRARAHTVFLRAADATARSGHNLGSFLRQLDADIRAGHTAPETVTAVMPSEVVLWNTGRRPVSEASVVNEQDLDDGGNDRPVTGQQTASGESTATIRGTVDVDEVSGTAVAVDTDRAAGRIEGEARARSVGPGGELIGVKLRQGS